MRLVIFLYCFCILLSGCQKETVTISTNANDFFYLRNAGSDMPVWVKGNTASKTFVVVVHGGPGGASLTYDPYFETLKTKYAIAYWDQRNSGNSQGNKNKNELTVSRFVDDMEKLITLIQYRYGMDISIFLYGHSWGGALGSAYLTKANNQQNIKGWIEIDGSHNFPLTLTTARQRLIAQGNIEIAAGKQVSDWQNIIDYCTSNDPTTSGTAALKVNKFGADAEKLLGIKKVIEPAIPLGGELSLLSVLFNSKSSALDDFIKNTVLKISYSSELNKIKIPALLLWGKYDFIVPYELADDAYNNLGSAYKRKVIFQNSGHTPMSSEPDLVTQEMDDFIIKFK